MEIFRVAHKTDFNIIYNIYQSAIKSMTLNNIFQWDEIYPNIKVINNDIKNKESFVLVIDNNIVSVIVLNNKQDIEYEAINWKNPNNNFAVIHRLCVDPKYQNLGIGKKTMAYAEKYLQYQKYKSIRLDAYSLNPYAIKLYEDLKYIKMGDIYFRKGKFILFEKTL